MDFTHRVICKAVAHDMANNPTHSDWCAEADDALHTIVEAQEKHRIRAIGRAPGTLSPARRAWSVVGRIVPLAIPFWSVYVERSRARVRPRVAAPIV